MRLSLGYLGEYTFEDSIRQRNEAVLAELLLPWSVARKLWGQAYILHPGGSSVFWNLLRNDFYGEAINDPRVQAAIQREVDRYEDLAAEFPGVEVLPEGSSAPGGSGPQPAIMTINFSTGGQAQWMNGFRPEDLGNRLMTINSQGKLVQASTLPPVDPAVSPSGGNSGGGNGNGNGNDDGGDDNNADDQTAAGDFPVMPIAIAVGIGILLLGGRR